MKFEILYLKGATPLDPDEMNGLLPDFITTQGELNLLERENIKVAVQKVLGRKQKNILTIEFCYNLHKSMFGEVWKWAGTPRVSDKSIGVDWRQITTQLYQLFENVIFQIDKSPADWKMLSAQFHHKLISIHPFPNGNGRHARLMTELLLQNYNQALPVWGIKNLEKAIDVEGPVREKYIKSLQEADNMNLRPLVDFMFY